MLEQPKPPEEEFLDHLPSKGATVSAVAILYTLANFKESTAALSSSAQDNKVRSYVTDKEALEAVKTFESNLEKVEKIIRQRNRERDEEYPYMLPSQLHFTVAAPATVEWQKARMKLKAVANFRLDKK